MPKENDPNYMPNPFTGKWVKKDGPTGRALREGTYQPSQATLDRLAKQKVGKKKDEEKEYFNKPADEDPADYVGRYLDEEGKWICANDEVSKRKRKEGYICNPMTGKWVLLEGKKGQAIANGFLPMKYYPDETDRLLAYVSGNMSKWDKRIYTVKCKGMNKVKQLTKRRGKGELCNPVTGKWVSPLSVEHDILNKRGNVYEDYIARFPPPKRRTKTKVSSSSSSGLGSLFDTEESDDQTPEEKPLLLMEGTWEEEKEKMRSKKKTPKRASTKVLEFEELDKDQPGLEEMIGKKHQIWLKPSSKMQFLAKICNQTSPKAKDPDYICNPESGLWVKKDGKKGQELIEKYGSKYFDSKRSKSPKKKSKSKKHSKKSKRSKSPKSKRKSKSKKRSKSPKRKSKSPSRRRPRSPLILAPPPAPKVPSPKFPAYTIGSKPPPKHVFQARKISRPVSGPARFPSSFRKKSAKSAPSRVASFKTRLFPTKRSPKSKKRVLKPRKTVKSASPKVSLTKKVKSRKFAKSASPKVSLTKKPREFDIGQKAVKYAKKYNFPTQYFKNIKPEGNFITKSDIQKYVTKYKIKSDAEKAMDEYNVSLWDLSRYTPTGQKGDERVFTVTDIKDVKRKEIKRKGFDFDTSQLNRRPKLAELYNEVIMTIR